MTCRTRGRGGVAPRGVPPAHVLVYTPGRHRVVCRTTESIRLSLTSTRLHERKYRRKKLLLHYIMTLVLRNNFFCLIYIELVVDLIFKLHFTLNILLVFIELYTRNLSLRKYYNMGVIIYY